MPDADMMSDAKKGIERRGRPRMPRENRKIQTLTFRLRDGLRDRLQARADTAGRSLSEEIERTCDLSFDRAATVSDLARRMWAEMAAVIHDADDPVAARRFAEKTWGEAWTANEWGGLLTFAAIAAASPGPGREAALSQLATLFEDYGDARTDYGPAPTRPDIASPESAAAAAYAIVLGAVAAEREGDAS